MCVPKIHQQQGIDFEHRGSHGPSWGNESVQPCIPTFVPRAVQIGQRWMGVDVNLWHVQAMLWCQACSVIRPVSPIQNESALGQLLHRSCASSTLANKTAQLARVVVDDVPDATTMSINFAKQASDLPTPFFAK